MKTLITAFSILIMSQLYSQYCDIEGRFTQAEYFTADQIVVIEDTVYATALNVDDVMQDLKMDIYYPDPEIDQLNEKPMIVLFHGGGFYQGNKSMFSFECMEFAKRGFIAATVQYRLGKASDIGSEALKRSYRARQDGHAAFRFLLENESLFGIDKGWLLIGGISAGSLLSQDLIYAENDEWNTLFNSVVTELGQTDTSGNSYNHSFSIKALYNNCGSASSLVIDNDELLPTIAFHKEYDHLVAIDESGYNYGSRRMHQELELNSICSQLTVDTVWYDPEVDGHCAYTDISGTITRVNKTSCFFKNIFCESCNAGYSEELLTSTCNSIATYIYQEWTNNITVYPNPADNQVYIDGLNGNESINVLSLSGQTIRTINYGQGIDVSFLSSGVYFLQIENKGLITNKRFLVW